MKRLLRSPGETDGGSPTPAPEIPPPAAAPACPSQPPQAAATVIAGKRTEREIELERDLDDERGRHATTAKEKKDRELRIAELEDELRRLKEIPATPAAKKTGGLRLSILEDEEE